MTSGKKRKKKLDYRLATTFILSYDATFYLHISIYMKREFETAMVNNSKNINKINNYLSLQTIEHEKGDTIGNLGHVLKKCGRVKSTF